MADDQQPPGDGFPQFNVPPTPEGTTTFFQVVKPIQVGIACTACRQSMDEIPSSGLIMADSPQAKLFTYKCPQCENVVQTPNRYPGQVLVPTSQAVTDLRALFTVQQRPPQQSQQPQMRPLTQEEAAALYGEDVVKEAKQAQEENE